MKRIALSVLLFTLLAAAAWSLPSIAILDAILSSGVDESVQVPITEKIIEEVVRSRDYVVLDRGSINQVLDEKKFQLSGIVADNEVRQAGVYLGADFVGVVKVSIVGSTYFISAKMINVESGAITAQVSREQRGDIEVVLTVAREVGRALMGGEMEAIEEPEPEPEPVAEEPKVAVPVVKETAPAREPRERTGARSHFIVSVFTPEYAGWVYDANQNDLDLLYNYSDRYQYGISAQIMQKLFGPVFGVAGLNFHGEYLEYYDAFYYDYEQYNNFAVIDLEVGAGVAFALGRFIQIFGSAGVSFTTFTLLDNWDYFGMEGESASGTGFFVDLGAELILLKFLSLNTRLHVNSATIYGDYIFYDGGDLTTVGVSIGAGIVY